MPVLSFPATLHVPLDFPTIQDAVDAAGDGDTILIADGVYSGPGNVSIQWDATIKHLVIRSENGRDHCIIDCLEEGRGFTLVNGQDRRDVIEGLTITNGFEGHAAGAILIEAASPGIINCMLINNRSFGDMLEYRGGGAIMVNGHANPLIEGNIIRGNYAGIGGGGISFSDGASGVVVNNIIEGNETQGNGGAIAVQYNSNPMIINNLIVNNASLGNLGGGIFTHISNPAIINNTIAYNTTYTDDFPGQGGGISMEGEPSPLIRNCIIWNNTSSSYTMNVHFPALAWLDINYSNVENDLDHIFDLNPHTNIDTLPGFMDPENGDFQLSGNSPCINKGTPDTSGLFLPPEDLGGNHRIFGGRVDIGVFEYNGPTAARSVMIGSGFHVYPNPCPGIMLLESSEASERDDPVLRIINAGGQVIMEKQLDAAKKLFTIDISNQPHGIYLLTLTSGQRLQFIEKIIKE